MKYDLEDRTTKYAINVIRLCKKLPKNTINYKLIPQLISSSGSIGANYREANDALGKKDFVHRIRIARKETKENLHWLKLILEANIELRINEEINKLSNEAVELKNILSAIINKSQ